MGILQDKVVIITGATSGIGEATANEAAREGATVVLAARREERGEAVVSKIREDGGRARFIRTDVTNEQDIERLVDETVREFGRLDGAFNNAGILGKTKTVETITAEDYHNVMDMNLKSIFLCMRSEILAMKENKGGAIVNCSSTVGTVGIATLGIYTASKHGILGATKAAALEVAQDGIRINSVQPGLTVTEILELFTKEEVEAIIQAIPMRRMAQAIECAKPVVFLLSDGASYITGTQLLVDGGFVTP